MLHASTPHVSFFFSIAVDKARNIRVNKDKAAISMKYMLVIVELETQFRRASTEYVSGKKRAATCNWEGKVSNAVNVPERKAIGNLRKLAYICASGTQFA